MYYYNMALRPWNILHNVTKYAESFVTRGYFVQLAFLSQHQRAIQENTCNVGVNICSWKGGKALVKKRETFFSTQFSSLFGESELFFLWVAILICRSSFALNACLITSEILETREITRAWNGLVCNKSIHFTVKDRVKKRDNS